MFENNVSASKAAMILDKYNLEKEILRCRNIGYEDAYEICEFLKGETDEWDVFLALERLSLDEFVEYLAIRYGIKWQQVISYRMI